MNAKAENCRERLSESGREPDRETTLISVNQSPQRKVQALFTAALLVACSCASGGPLLRYEGTISLERGGTLQPDFVRTFTCLVDPSGKWEGIAYYDSAQTHYIHCTGDGQNVYTVLHHKKFEEAFTRQHGTTRRAGNITPGNLPVDAGWPMLLPVFAYVPQVRDSLLGTNAIAIWGRPRDDAFSHIFEASIRSRPGLFEEQVEILFHVSEEKLKAAHESPMLNSSYKRANPDHFTEESSRLAALYRPGDLIAKYTVQESRKVAGVSHPKSWLWEIYNPANPGEPVMRFLGETTFAHVEDSGVALPQSDGVIDVLDMRFRDSESKVDFITYPVTNTHWPVQTSAAHHQLFAARKAESASYLPPGTWLKARPLLMLLAILAFPIWYCIVQYSKKKQQQTHSTT